MNLAQTLQSKFKLYSKKKAIIFEDVIFTYDDIYKAVNQVSELLQLQGIKKGDRVAVQVSKSPEIIFFHIAAIAAGAIVLHLNEDYKSSEVQYFIENSNSTLLITDSKNYLKSKKVLSGFTDLQILTTDQKFPGAAFFPDELKKCTRLSEPAYTTGDNDIAMILYTSGTTGKPKGAMISHSALAENMGDLRELWRLSEQDISLHTLPLVHGHGLILALQGALEAGATTIMHRRFDPDHVWDTIEKEKCTLFMGVPTMYQRMLESLRKRPHKPDLSSMRLFACGSAPLSKKLFNSFKNATEHTILERYGLTETLVIASNPYEVNLRKAKSIGFPLPRVAVRLIGENNRDVKPGEIGEVCVKGNNVYKGYWNNPEETKKTFLEKWFRTGDLGYMDSKDNMRLYLVGRSKEMIISGGYNVYPKEVENCLEKQSEVVESAVFALPDTDYGEKVVAAVILKNNANMNEEKLRIFCKKNIAGYKCPKNIFFIDELPRTAMGKILKNKLKNIILKDLKENGKKSSI